jgi:hypothetical protein
VQKLINNALTAEDAEDAEEKQKTEPDKIMKIVGSGDCAVSFPAKLLNFLRVLCVLCGKRVF